jgi:hypothetical protein
VLNDHGASRILDLLEAQEKARTEYAMGVKEWEELCAKSKQPQGEQADAYRNAIDGFFNCLRTVTECRSIHVHSALLQFQHSLSSSKEMSTPAALATTAAARQTLASELRKRPHWTLTTWINAVNTTPFNFPIELSSSLPPFFRPFTLFLPLLFPCFVLDHLFTSISPPACLNTVLNPSSSRISPAVIALEEALCQVIASHRQLYPTIANYGARTLEGQSPLYVAAWEVERTETAVEGVILVVLLARAEQRRRWRAGRVAT